MPTAEARIPTERSSRYLVQLCHHASQISRDPQARHGIPGSLDAEWSDTHGSVSTAGGTCTLRATPDALILRIEADTEHTLHRMQGLITTNLTRFSRRDPLTINWTRLGEPPAPAGPAATPRPRRRTIALIVVAALAVAAHVILGGAVLAVPQWTGWAADVILAVVLLKLALIGLGYLAHHRRKAHSMRND